MMNVQTLGAILGSFIVLLAAFSNMSGCCPFEMLSPLNSHALGSTSSKHCDTKDDTPTCSFSDCSSCGASTSDAPVPLFKTFATIDVLNASNSLLVPVAFSSFWHPPA